VPSVASIGTGAARALVTIKSPVGVQIRTNGKVLMQGSQQSGSFELRFSGRAVLIVDDGSKVELSYGDWAHGPLGHPGRKRRLVLNSEDF
jgi:hypothetical protein